MSGETREVVCILCPMGCRINVEVRNGEVVKIEEAECDRGRDYAVQEVKHPVRDFFTTVRVEGGGIPLLSVRSTQPIPKDLLTPCASQLAKIVIHAPVRLGDTIVKNIRDLGTDIVATKGVEEA